MHRLWIGVILMSSLAMNNSVRAQTPGEIGHQGILTDADGVPISEGSFEVVFTLYDQANEGTALWTEQQTVNVEEGLFTALLGSVTPIDLPFDQPYWLEVEVDGEQLNPRLRLTTSPYSRRAATVDSVGLEALALRLIPSNRLNPDGAPVNTFLSVMAEDSAGWTVIGPEHIPDKLIAITKINAVGGATGQVLTVQSDSVVWADPPEITGAAIPNKSVRSTKLNSEDGEVGDVLVAADGDSAVWGKIATSTITDAAVTLEKISAAGASERDFLMARGDTVSWVDASDLGDLSIPVAKLQTQEAAEGRVLLIGDENAAEWGLTSTSSIANKAVTAQKIDPDGAGDGQILTAQGGDAVWSDPAGIGKASVNYDRLSAAGGAQGEVLTVVEGDTVAWSTIDGSNIVGASIPPGKMSVSGAGSGAVLQVSEGSAAWGSIDGASIDNGSIPLQKLNPGGPAVGNVLSYDGANLVWTEDAVQLPLSATVSATDTFGIRISSPSVIEGSGFAIYGIMTSSSGGAFASAIRGENRSTSALGVGVWGSHEGGGWGVYGRSTSGRGVYGSSPDGFAGYFSGNVRVTGSIEKAGGSFKIDHPLDPENKYLLHSFVESPDMMNVYNGNVTLDASGRATVTLPDWFEALNIDYRYQLTPIGGPGPNLHVAQEISGNRFVIGGGAPGMKVSWQVTGVRNDAWARSNRIPVELPKEGAEQGTYLHPQAFGVSRARSLDAATEQLNER